MINLMPPQVRQNIGYARQNTRLRKMSMWLTCLLTAILLTFLGGLLFLKQTSHSLAKQLDTSKAQLALQDQAKVKAQVEDLSSTLKLAVQVLSKEVLFSKLLKQVGSVMPRGSVLTSLSINETSGGLDLQAKATDYETATQVQVNLQDPKNLLFDKVDIVNVQCQTSSAAADATAAKYPCTVQMRALFSQTNSFLFIGGNKQ